MWRIYKEGQGKWSRGLVAAVIGVGAVFGVASLHQALPALDEDWKIMSWTFDYQFLIDAPLLIGAVIFGVWLFNHPPAADFLIETETELKSKVVWPSRQEEINNSIVVVVAVIFFMVMIMCVDAVFSTGSQWMYNESALMQQLEDTQQDDGNP